jgi:hypothetical protein
LTNNAIQKFSQNYGEFEEGNQLSFADFEAYLQEKRGQSFLKTLAPKIKDYIKVAS